MPDPETVARYERAWKRMRRIRVAILFTPVPFYGGAFLAHALSPTGGSTPLYLGLTLLPTAAWCWFCYRRLWRIPCPRCGQSFDFFQPYFSSHCAQCGLRRGAPPSDD